MRLTSHISLFLSKWRLFSHVVLDVSQRKPRSLLIFPQGSPARPHFNVRRRFIHFHKVQIPSPHIRSRSTSSPRRCYSSVIIGKVERERALRRRPIPSPDWMWQGRNQSHGLNGRKYIGGKPGRRVLVFCGDLWHNLSVKLFLTVFLKEQNIFLGKQRNVFFHFIIWSFNVKHVEYFSFNFLKLKVLIFNFNRLIFYSIRFRPLLLNAMTLRILKI